MHTEPRSECKLCNDLFSMQVRMKPERANLRKFWEVVDDGYIVYTNELGRRHSEMATPIFNATLQAHNTQTFAKQIRGE